MCWNSEVKNSQLTTILFSTALEPRIMTRWDAHKFARDAYNAGIRFIGGCCGIEPYHIRAVAEEVGFLNFNLERKVLHGLVIS